MKTRDRQVFEKLVEKALELGASAAAGIDTVEITVEPELVRHCVEPLCPGYGASAHCPPHGMTPAAFKELLDGYSHAVVFKIDTPTETVLDDRKTHVFRKLHTIGAKLETFARKQGFARARAFAGGSCREIFCPGEPCLRLENKPCRHEELARPSMSAVGINVFKLMETLGWQIRTITKDTKPQEAPSAVLSGLTLIC